MLTREQVLDELQDLSTVEHALCVEYLFLQCALGGGVELPPDADPIRRQVEAAAEQAFSLADREMRLLGKINRALVTAGRGPSLDRATAVGGTGSPVAIAPLTAVQLEGFLDREHAIAAAVDARYALLPTTLEPLEDPSAEDPLSLIEFIVKDGSAHAAAFADLQTALADLEPHQYLIAHRDVPADDVELGLREVADEWYGFVLFTLEVGFAQGFGTSPAVSAMIRLGRFLPQLVERGLLPAFTLP